MSFAPLTIEHAGGVRQVLSYTLPRVEERRELQAVITRGSAEFTILGDAGARPEAFTVEAEVPGATLGAALALAYVIVSEAETATVVRTHLVDVPVLGLMAYRVEARSASSARLVLEFAPAGVLFNLALREITDALEANGTPASREVEAWLSEYYVGQPWMVLSNPTDRIRLLLRGEGTARAWWGDGTEQVETLASGSDTTFERVYASAGTRGVVVLGDVREIRATASGDVTAFGGDVAGLPTGLTVLLVMGLNTLSGDVAGLPPGLEFLQLQGFNTLSGNVAGLPPGLEFLRVLGSNTLSGNVASLPTGLEYLYVTGSNTLSGDVAGVPTGLTYLHVRGSNTLSGNVAGLPTGLTDLYVTGSNTLSGDVASVPPGLEFLRVLGSNTLSGDVAGLPTGLEYLFVAGSNTLSGDVANLPPGLEFLLVTGSNTLTATSDVLPAPLSYCRVSRLTVQSEVDYVLAAMVAIIGETKPRSERFVQLNEGGGAAPSAAGLADRDTLVAAGYTVTVSS